MKHAIYILLIILMVSCQMKTAAPGLEEAFSKAGSNRSELLRVLRHYEESGDSLKLRAAAFLIGNMADKGYLTGVAIDEYYAFIDSVYQIEQEEYDTKYIYETFRKQAKYQKEPPLFKGDVQTLSADYLIRNIDEAFAVWNRPWNQHLTFEEFCEWVLPYRLSSETPEEWRTVYRKRFEQLVMADSIQTAKQACDTLNNVLARLYTAHIESRGLPIALRPSSLLQIKYGLCNDYSNFALFAMRAAGIPVAIETVPHWGRGNNGHLFCVVYDNDGTFHDFAGVEGHTVDEHLIRFRHEMPKVYRETFGKQKESLAMQHGNEDIPTFFKNPYIVDATANYSFIGARDITVDFPTNANRRFAYLCVFDPQGWTPVAWGNVKGKQAEFKAIGPNIVYHAALYADKKLQLVGNPFLLDTLGQITYFTPQAETMEYVLERKYKHAGYLDYLPPIMVGSKFQGANQPDFSDAVTLYTFTEEPDFRYTTVTTNNPKAFRYVRYLSSNQTHGNMAEVEFYTVGGSQPLQGKVIGEYEPSIYNPRSTADKMFDGDALTFFHTNDSLSWGGLDLEKTTVIDYIRYIIRNDDNGIRKGHEYELFYIKEGEWVSLGKQTATEDDRLLYKNIPQGALYWLRDYTKGSAERIFTIENKQVKWH